MRCEPSELHRRPPVGRAKGQIRAGLRYAWQAWELRVPLLMMAVIGTLAYNFSVILPLFAHDVFHRGAGTYSALTVAMGIGALAGGLTIASRRRPSYRLLVVVSLAFGVFILAVAAAPTLPLCLALLVRWAPPASCSSPRPTRCCSSTRARAMRGRVMALWAVVFLGFDAHRRAADRLSRRPLRRALRAGCRRRRDPAGRRLGGLRPASHPQRRAPPQPTEPQRRGPPRSYPRSTRTSSGARPRPLEAAHAPGEPHPRVGRRRPSLW